MTKYAIGMGSNQDDRLGHMKAGVAALRDLGTMTAISPIYETEPVGGPEQGSYLNAVVVIETDLSPEALLDALLRIEEERSRLRTVRWGPRTLDLDIVTSDGGPVYGDRLVIPHPESGNRRFVLQPLTDVWPEAEVSGGVSAGEALFGLVGQEVELVSHHWAGESDE